MPEKWSDFEVPEELTKRANGHEDKIMVAKWTFVKPELTYMHLKRVANLLE